MLLSALALAAAASAAPDGFRESVRLSPIASGVAGRPVTVWCARTPVIWRDTVRAVLGPNAPLPGGWAEVPDAGSMQLSPRVCQMLEGWLRGKSVPTPEDLGRGIRVLVHESVHLRTPGVDDDEGVTDCTALSLLPTVARTSFKIRSAKVLRSVVQVAWAEHNASGAKYRGSC